MNYPALVFWALIVWSITASSGTVLALLLASIPFASLALLPLTVTAGMSILPQSMFAVVLILKVVAPQVMPLSPNLLAALRLRHLGCLALFLVVGIVAAMVMPRLFSGQVVILPMRENAATALLDPIQANFTQSGYVTLSVVTAFAVMLMSDKPNFVGALLTSILAGGTVCIATGLIDLAAASTGMGSLLAPFRNASYAYLTHTEIVGVRRVVGFTPEASAYGPICVSFAAAIALLRTLYAEGRQRTLATMVAVGLVVMALLSTSSSAYGGLAILGLVYATNWIRRAVFSSSLGQSGLAWELLVGLGLMVVLLFVLIARADLLDPLLNLIEELIFNKPLSSSFYERSEWNGIAWDTVASTWGLGVGLGSTRTSNWFAAIVSSAGLLGALFMGTFLVQTFFRHSSSRTPLSVELLWALKLSLLPALAMAGVDSPGADFGIWMGVLFGAITGLAAFDPSRSAVKPGVAKRPIPSSAGGRSVIEAGSGWSNSPAPLRNLRRGNGPDKPAPRPSF